LNKTIRNMLIVLAVLLGTAASVGNIYLYYEADRKIKSIEEELNEIRKQVTFFEEAQDINELFL